MEAVSDVYTIPQEHLDFCATIGQIARERIAPRSAEIDERAEYPWDVRKLLAEQDILGLPFATEYGGTGTGTLMLNMAVEEIAKVDASCALILMVQELGTLPIQLFGSDELKQRFLPQCATRRVVAGVRAVRARGRLGPGGDEDDGRAGRRGMGDQRHQELDLQPRRRRLLHHLRGHRPRDAAADRLRRRGRPAGLQRRQARAQARDPRLADRAADLRRRARAAGKRDRRGRQGAVGRAGHARAHAAGRRRAGGRDRAGRDRLRRRLRARAPSVRQGDQRVPGDPVQARRHGNTARPPRASCCTRPARWPIRATRRPRSTPRWRRSSARTRRWR